MKIIQLPRRGGKTYQIATLLKANPTHAAVVFSHVAREGVLHEHDPDGKLKLAVRIFSVQDVLNHKLLSHRFDVIHVDNLDMVLRALLGGDVGLVTTTEGASNDEVHYHL